LLIDRQRTGSGRDRDHARRSGTVERGARTAESARLEERLLSARLTDPDPDNGRVDMGERVRLRALDSGKRLEVELVGREADPTYGRISIASPLGKALLGLRRGEIVDFDTPRGMLRYKILAVI
jgi:transcription elongation factor GreA